MVNKVEYKIGGSVPFLGARAGPHLAQCGLGRGLPPYQVASDVSMPISATAELLFTKYFKGEYFVTLGAVIISPGFPGFQGTVSFGGQQCSAVRLMLV